MNIDFVLKSCHLFSSLTDEELGRLAAIARLRHVKAGTVLFSENDDCDRFYVLAAGRVKIYILNEQGREQILHIVNPSETFAEAAMFAGQTFPAFAETLENSDLIVIPSEPFVTEISRNPNLMLKLMSGLAKWLRMLVDLVDDISLKDVQTRLAKYLLRQAADKKISIEPGALIPLGMNKSQLAKRLGTVPETLSRSLYKLQKDGAVKVASKHVEVSDPDAFKAAAGSE